MKLGRRLDRWVAKFEKSMAIFCVYCLGTVFGFFCVDESLFWAYLKEHVHCTGYAGSISEQYLNELVILSA